jgi:hypothetical protein
MSVVVVRRFSTLIVLLRTTCGPLPGRDRSDGRWRRRRTDFMDDRAANTVPIITLQREGAGDRGDGDGGPLGEGEDMLTRPCDRRRAYLGSRLAAVDVYSSVRSFAM